MALVYLTLVFIRRGGRCLSPGRDECRIPTDVSNLMSEDVGSTSLCENANHPFRHVRSVRLIVKEYLLTERAR